MGAAITFWRRDRRYKQKELAERCGWQAGRISKYETGGSWPDDDSLQTLSKVLEVPRETFYLGQEALLRHRARVLRTGGETIQEEARSAAEREVREPVPRLTVELAERWEDLEQAEAALRTRRRLLEIETQHALLQAAVAGPPHPRSPAGR